MFAGAADLFHPTIYNSSPPRGQYAAAYSHTGAIGDPLEVQRITGPFVNPPTPSRLAVAPQQPAVSWATQTQLRSVPPAQLSAAPKSALAPSRSTAILPIHSDLPLPLADPRCVAPLAYTALDPVYPGWAPLTALPSPESTDSTSLNCRTSNRSRSLSPSSTKAVRSRSSSQPRPDDDLVRPPPTMNGRTSHSHRVPRNYVKRPPNGFLRFRSHFIARNASLPKGDPARLEESRVISRAAGMVWRSLSTVEKDRWKKEAKLALEEFKKQHPDDEASKKERARVRKRSKQHRIHVPVDDDSAKRAAAVALGESWVANQ